jgi:ketosteroid isomerase-like protein
MHNSSKQLNQTREWTMIGQAEAVQVVQDFYAAWGRWDVAALLALLDDEVEWHFNGRPQDIPFAGRWLGQAQMVDFLQTVALSCDVLEFGPHEIIPLGEHILSLGYEQVKVKTTGRTFETDWAHLFTVRHGKVVRLREFCDTAVMARAFLK